nr:polymer-forming cytoskeletal protein [Pseudobdellovibrionaceae bacterium]
MSELVGVVSGILDKGSYFEGRLSFEGTVQIGGEFKGEIFTNDTLIVNEGAVVSAQIEADTILISGKVEGNLFARKKI